MPRDIPVLSDGDGLPAQGANAIANGFPPKGEADAIARSIAERHKKGRKSKAQRDLLAEMYMMHLDGEGDAQWVSIVNSSRLRVAPNIDGGIRCSSNLLRPITANYVSYQTSIPYRVLASAKSDRKSRDTAKIDTIYANNFIQTQRLNELFAEALYLGVPYGFCPIHATAREDTASEAYQTPEVEGGGQQSIRPIFIDAWVGDPFSMVFNSGATRRSLSSATYERVMPLSLVQSAFPNVPWIGELRGRKDLPSASRFQQTARKWVADAVHGTPVLSGEGDEENVALVCFEEMPGVDPNYRDGRLVILGLSGVAENAGDKIGTPLLLHDGPLPGRRFSFVRLYSDQRFDDPYGFPWITPLDELQVRRNNIETLLVAGGARAAKPQLAVGPAGGGDDDTLGYEEDGIIETIDGFTPAYLKYPTDWMSPLEARLQATEEKMFQIGGWQASSRGEAAGNSGVAIVRLQNADDSIHGPVNRGVVGAISEYLQLVHCLTTEFSGPIPIPVKVAGDDYGYLKGNYIYADQLSSDPPDYVVVSGFGSTKEAVAQQLIQLAQAQGADGEPLLTTSQLRKQYPDQSIWPVETDITEIKKRRAQAINYMIRDLVMAAAQNPQFAQMPQEWQVQMILQQLDTTEPIERDDDLQLNIDSLSELIQDTSEAPLVRAVARGRQGLNYDWQANIHTASQPPVQQQPGAANPAESVSSAAPEQSPQRAAMQVPAEVSA